LLRGYKALVFPSLHDSGGIVVLEALSEGLPVVCLDLGGPGTVVNESCGIVVPTENADETQTIGRISNAMISLGTMPDVVWRRLSAGATAKANELSWDSLTGHVAMGVNRDFS
jgi:glycosyltransferase involved in cell wall biosynthesis